MAATSHENWTGAYMFELPLAKKLPEEPRILLNAIQCKSCKDVIVSYNVHDFKWCGCHSVAVDGGKSYLKRAGDPTSYVEMSVTL